MRQVLAVLAAALVLAVAVVSAFRAITSREQAAAPAADAPAATVDAYLDAWTAGDHATMADLVRDPPPRFVEHHEQLRAGLRTDTLSTERLAVVEDVDGRATARAAVTADVPEAGEVTWEVELALLRERGEWGVAWEPATLHPEWSPGLRFVVTTAEVGRAPILAADGTELAGPGRRLTFGIEPGSVDSRQQVVDAFEEAIPGSGASADRLLSRDDLVDGWFYPVTSLPADRAEDARRTLTGVPGVLRRAEEGARNLLADGFAVHVVGRTGEATAEELEELGPPYVPGDVVGRSGLEEVLERRLAGVVETRVELRDGEDGPVRTTLATATATATGGRGGADGAEADPAQGPPGAVTTTIDVRVQRAIENALAGRDTPAAIVAVDGDDGAIRGSASRPIDGFDRALQGRYPPGTALAPVVVDALAASDGDATAVIDCPAEAVVAGRRIENVAGAALGEVPLPAAAAGGCATALAAVGADLGAEALVAAAERFGAGRDPALPLVANGFGFPEPPDAGAAAVAAAGQGRAEVSPLALAGIGAASATGRWWPPYLLAGRGPGEASSLAPGATDGLERLLAAAGPADAPGLVGLTGNARGFDGVVHAWFVGSIDGLGLAVLVEDAADDPAAAGPLAARFARELRALADAPADGDG